MKRRRFLKNLFCFLVTVFLMSGTVVLAAELRVPSQYPCIQDAIEAAMPGDAVLVADGVYKGDGNTNLLVDKAITIKSENGSGKCTIDCAGTSRAFTFSGSDASGAVLTGFTITGGSGQTGGLLTQYENWGGAILILNAGSVTISDCTLSNNVVTRFGGAIASVASSPIITHCIVENNSAGSGGGGLFIYGDSPQGSAPQILNCTIAKNPGNNPGIARGAGAYLIQSSATFYDCVVADNTAIANGGAFFFSNPSSPTIKHCTIANNSVSGFGSSYGGGGICSFSRSSPAMTNSILWGNTAAIGAEVFLSNSSLTISYSDVNIGQQNEYLYLSPSTQSEIKWGDGNIAEDPLFAGEGDYHLTSDSPCIDAGIDELSLSRSVDSSGELDFDIEGDPRVLGEAPDMGADEFREEAAVLQVEIDIKPGCPENKINLNSWGVLAVAVKTTGEFDATFIDPSTVEFAEARPVWWIRHDVDHDRDKDMIFFFIIRQLDLDENRIDAILTGRANDVAFEGTDKLTIIKPKGNPPFWRADKR